MLYNAYSQKLSTGIRSKKNSISYLNLMVVGSVGTGKTSFIRTFYETLRKDIIQGSFVESRPMLLKEPVQSTQEITSISMQIRENGYRTALTLIDTPGISVGFEADNQVRYIAKYIDRQFERTLAEESKVKRDAKAVDTHIHSCLYFIDSSSTLNGLSDSDRCILRMLSTRVNVIPIIGKADTLTMAQVYQLKQVFRREVFDIFHIPIYGYIEIEDDDEPQSATSITATPHMAKMLGMLQQCIVEDNDEDARVLKEYLNNIPFTVISYEEDVLTGRPVTIQPSRNSVMMDVTRRKSACRTPVTASGGTILGRRYPWAVVECNNTNHCDFDALKATVLAVHRDLLRMDTFERFYEQYRTEQLLKRNIGKIMKVESKEGVALI